jgi:hypothetical protein
MAKPGQNKGNKHAALPDGQRQRVQFSMSISGERLKHLIAYMQATSGSSSDVTNEQIAGTARDMLEEWIDNLQV